MKALQMSGPDQVEMVEVSIPSIEPDEVLIRTHFVSLDASDVDLYRGTRPEGFSHYPIIMGHAFTGEIAAVGGRVDGLMPGDKVASESLLYCGKCRNCSRGETDLCEKGYSELGFTHPGGLAEYVAVPAYLVHMLPSTALLDEATLLSTSAVVGQAFLHAQLLPGDNVAIVGDDVTSLLATQVAHLYNPASISLIGFREDRLALGRTFGATHTINASRDDSHVLVRSLSRGRGADLTFEGTAQAEAAVEAMLLARRGGIVLLTGTIGSNALLSIESDLLIRNQLRIFGIFGATKASWNRTLQLYRSGMLNLAPLISSHFPLADYQDALDLMTSRQGQILRLVIDIKKAP